MVLSNEVFNWQVGDTCQANWTYTESEVVYTGTLEVTLSTCVGSAEHVGIISYNGILYLIADGTIDSFSYAVNGCYNSNYDGVYTQNNTVLYNIDTNKNVYAASVENGILAVQDMEYSIPYIITAGFTLTSTEIYNWWFNRLYHGSISEGAFSQGYETVAGDNEEDVTYVSDIQYPNGQGAFAAGVRTVAKGAGATSLGLETEANGLGSLSAGYSTKANGFSSQAFGSKTRANGNQSFSQGHKSKANGVNSVAVGNSTIANGNNSFSEGDQSVAEGLAAHAAGYKSTALGNNSVAIGSESESNGLNSFAGGIESKAEGRTGIAFGDNVISRGKYQVSLGRFNNPGTVNNDTQISEFLFTLGDGSDEENRHNVFSIGADGSITISDGTNTRTISPSVESGESDSEYYISDVTWLDETHYRLTFTAYSGDDEFTNNYVITKDSHGLWTKVTNLNTGLATTFSNFPPRSDRVNLYYLVDDVTQIKYKMVLSNGVYFLEEIDSDEETTDVILEDSITGVSYKMIVSNGRISLVEVET